MFHQYKLEKRSILSIYCTSDTFGLNKSESSASFILSIKKEHGYEEEKEKNKRAIEGYIFFLGHEVREERKKNDEQRQLYGGFNSSKCQSIQHLEFEDISSVSMICIRNSSIKYAYGYLQTVRHIPLETERMYHDNMSIGLFITKM